MNKGPGTPETASSGAFFLAISTLGTNLEFGEVNAVL